MSDQSNDVQKADVPEQKSRRWLKITLVLSLMLNALFVGAIGMGMYRFNQHGGWSGGHHGGSGIAVGARQFFRDLPRERRKELRQKFGKLRREMHAQRADTRQAVNDIVTALDAPELDREKLRVALRAYSTARHGNATHHEEYMLKVVDSLTTAERKKVASSMKKRLERRNKRRRWYRDDKE